MSSTSCFNAGRTHSTSWSRTPRRLKLFTRWTCGQLKLDQCWFQEMFPFCASESSWLYTLLALLNDMLSVTCVLFVFIEGAAL